MTVPPEPPKPPKPAPPASAVPSALRPGPLPAAAAGPTALRAITEIAPSPAGSPVSHVADAMPIALQEQLMDLETWAQANRRDAKWDTVKFWALKIPAIVVSAGSGVFAYFKVDSVAVIGGAVASLCVLIDALNPGGALRNAHLRAFNELRILQGRMKAEWQVGFLLNENRNTLAAKIIEGATKEKERINDAITNAETSLAVTSRRGKH